MRLELTVQFLTVRVRVVGQDAEDQPRHWFGSSPALFASVTSQPKMVQFPVTVFKCLSLHAADAKTTCNIPVFYKFVASGRVASLFLARLVVLYVAATAPRFPDYLFNPKL